LERALKTLYAHVLELLCHKNDNNPLLVAVVVSLLEALPVHHRRVVPGNPYPSLFLFDVGDSVVGAWRALFCQRVFSDKFSSIGDA